ncbi:MAG TPA: SDR family oxidoreductase [Solirubrobacterales bacterium]|jgi:NAD(P)-dependent dehydrogenase (short-subunit alcohol dehydrogenase family)|nr:SDR family oxidoreductase [Solirubrobacterales bacterium]
MSKVVVVTGGSAGVGRAAAKAFARRGDRVALLARGIESLDAAAREVTDAGGEALTVPTDVADHDQVEAAANRVEDELGPIDVWVNNAMTTVFARFADIEPGEFARTTEVTYLGVVWGTMAALRRMRPRDRGVVVQVGSALAYRGIPLQSPYCGAKHAIKGFTESVRCELLHDGSPVQVNMVQLPALNTPQFEIGRTKMDRSPQPVPPMYQPEVAAEAIVWASEHRRREIQVAAPTVEAILANKLFPGLLDRYLARTGFDSQLTDERLDGEREGNLFAPVPGDHGTRGRFSDARGRSVLLELAEHRRALLGVAGLAALSALGAAARRSA